MGSQDPLSTPLPPEPARFSPRWEISERRGPVVVVDVLRAFTTAAYAFGAGATHIFLVGSVEEALDFKATNPGVLAMGENYGEKPPGFNFSNSPVEIATADVTGRTLVQRTSAGTQGVVQARRGDAHLVRQPRVRISDRSRGAGQRTRSPDVRDQRPFRGPSRDLRK